MNIVFGSRLEHEQLKAAGVPLTYEQKIKGDRMVTFLLIAVVFAMSVAFAVVQA